MGCASCGGSMKKTATKKPAMRGGGKISTMKTPTYKIGGKTTKKMMVGGATEICKDGDPKCKEGNYNKGRGTGGGKLNLFERNKQKNFRRKKG